MAAMRADLPLGLPAYSEVVVNLRSEVGVEAADEVYARVLRAEPRAKLPHQHRVYRHRYARTPAGQALRG